jgi:cytidylate kinase
VPIVAVTREMGSLGSFVAERVAREVGYEFLRTAIVREAAREYRVRESRLIGTVEEAPGLLDRLRRRGVRHRAYLEAAVLDAALRERVVLLGRWSTLFLRGVPHAIRVRICAPRELRVRRLMHRHALEAEDAGRRLDAHDLGVRARMRQLFDVDWTDPLLYDLVINTEAVTVPTAVRQVLDLVAAPEFQATPESRQRLAERALAARVRATLKATPDTRGVDLVVRATGDRVTLEGLVASSAERDAVFAVARGVPGVAAVEGELKIFQRRVR